MSEEATTETTATEATTETTAPVAVATPQSFIDGEGNFTEGWKDHYVSEDLRGEAIFDRINSIHGMTKSLANLAIYLRNANVA